MKPFGTSYRYFSTSASMLLSSLHHAFLPGKLLSSSFIFYCLFRISDASFKSLYLSLYLSFWHVFDTAEVIVFYEEVIFYTSFL